MTKSLALLAVAPALLAQTEYFPLQQGNVWIYRSGPISRTEEVTAIKSVGEEPYFELNGDTLVRFTADGTLVAHAGGQDQVWARFGAAEGETYSTEILPCGQQATLVSRAAKYSGPIGNFDNALKIGYSGGTCADAGLVEETYLPWVGLVQRVETTIAGPRTFDLVYARLGGVTVVTASEVAFSLTLDKSVYTVDRMPITGPQRPAPVMLARITLRHSQPEPLRITFSSGQTYELVLRDESGEIVYRWSDGQAFTQALRTVEFPAGEKNWTVSVALSDPDGDPFPAGHYTAEAWLVTAGEKKYSATVAFEIRHIF